VSAVLVQAEGADGRIYASYAELMGDTEGYDRELYLGGVH